MVGFEVGKIKKVPKEEVVEALSKLWP